MEEDNMQINFNPSNSVYRKIRNIGYKKSQNAMQNNSIKLQNNNIEFKGRHSDFGCKISKTVDDTSFNPSDSGKSEDILTYNEIFDCYILHTRIIGAPDTNYLYYIEPNDTVTICPKAKERKQIQNEATRGIFEETKEIFDKNPDRIDKEDMEKLIKKLSNLSDE